MVDWLVNLLERQQGYAVWFVFLVAFAEACPGLGLFVSGAVLLSIASFLYMGQIESLPVIMLTAFTGAFLSDQLGFFTGRLLGPKLRTSKFMLKRQAILIKADAVLYRYGDFAVVIGRLLTMVRSIIPLLLGMTEMPLKRYLLLDFTACLIWSLGLVGLVLGLDTIIEILAI